MKQIDEWNPVYPKETGPSEPHDPAGGAAPDLVGNIRRRLMALETVPSTVHFYRGEGLRWIRVGFDHGVREPADVETVGRAIQAGLRDAGKPLYFHALRPYDLLFFIEHFDPESTGLPPGHFGALLDDVLAIWWPTPAAARRKKV